MSWIDERIKKVTLRKQIELELNSKLPGFWSDLVRVIREDMKEINQKYGHGPEGHAIEATQKASTLIISSAGKGKAIVSIDDKARKIDCNLEFNSIDEEEFDALRTFELELTHQRDGIMVKENNTPVLVRVVSEAVLAPFIQ